MTNFSIDWPHGHQTRDGRPARIICTDRKLAAIPGRIACIPIEYDPSEAG